MKIPDMTRRFICRRCQRETGHWPIAIGVVKGSEKKLKREESSFQTFQVFQCKDCEVTTYCIDTKIHPGPMMGDSWTQTTDYYPPLPLRIKPVWYVYLPDEYQAILNEVYNALDNSAFFLASIGIRTALDQLIVEKIGDAGNFAAKLKKLFTNNIIDKTEMKILLSVIDAGNASAHRSYKPRIKLINNMIDILDAIFYKLVVEPEKKKELDRKADELCESTPKRKQCITSR